MPESTKTDTLGAYAGYPRGWFVIQFSDELPPGAVKPLKYFGKDLVLFRTESGEPTILDAFCPHMGAHLGHGGKVRATRSSARSTRGSSTGRGRARRCRTPRRSRRRRA